MKIIKILHSICFSNISLIPRVAIAAFSFFCITRDQCLKGQSDYLLSLCLKSNVKKKKKVIWKSLYWMSKTGVARKTAVSTKLQMGPQLLF